MAVEKARPWSWQSPHRITGPPTVSLGNDLATGERPQAVVPAGCWQSARSLGAWTLVGCTVAPGFEFGGFELAPEGFEPPGSLHPKDVAGGAQK